MDTGQVRAIAEPHFLQHDLEVLAPDVDYVDVSTGKHLEGRDQAAELTAFYNQVAFDAIGVEVLHASYCEDGTALVELTWKARHVGTFEGVEATGEEVTAQVCLVAHVGEEHVERVHLYFPRSHVLSQLRGVLAGEVEAPG